MVRAMKRRGRGRVAGRWLAAGPLVWMLIVPAAIADTAVHRDCDDCPELVPIPGGTAQIGNDDRPREAPAHTVSVAGFWLGRTEVTVGQFRAFVEDTGHVTSDGCFGWTGSGFGEVGGNWRDPGFAQGDDHPVVCVTWSDATAYADWLSGRTGQPYRLPSEAELEYALRTGIADGDRRPETICDIANVHDLTSAEVLGMTLPPQPCVDGAAQTAPVGGRAPAGSGAVDLLGNVAEWTADVWFDDHTAAPADGRPRTGDDPRRVVRGGAWKDDLAVARPGSRVGLPDGFRSQYFGFRIARDGP